MIDRFRSRRDTARRARAIQRAPHSANPPAVREEIPTIAQRYYG